MRCQGSVLPVTPSRVRILPRTCDFFCCASWMTVSLTAWMNHASLKNAICRLLYFTEREAEDYRHLPIPLWRCAPGTRASVPRGQLDMLAHAIQLVVASLASVSLSYRTSFDRGAPILQLVLCTG